MFKCAHDGVHNAVFMANNDDRARVLCSNAIGGVDIKPLDEMSLSDEMAVVMVIHPKEKDAELHSDVIGSARPGEPRRSKLFVEWAVCGEAVVKNQVHFHPKDNQFWRVELWARQGSFKRERIIDCAEQLTANEVTEYMQAGSIEFMQWFVDELSNHKEILRLEGKFGDAYNLDFKPLRYGYRAYVEIK